MFAKVFEQILDSSIAEDWMVRHVFEDLLKLADRHGYVDKTHRSIAGRLNMPLEIVTMAIDKLSQPDPESRSQEAEGRRIVLIDTHRSWGWKIVNYAYYRDIRDEEGRREYFRVQKRKQRSEKKTAASENVQDIARQDETVQECPTMSTHVDVEADVKDTLLTHAREEAPPQSPSPPGAVPPRIEELARSVGESLQALAEPARDYFEGRELQVANDLFREFRIPVGQDYRLTTLAGEALVFECERLGSPELAIESMRTAMSEAKARGDTINKFWFQDQEYDESKRVARRENGGENKPGTTQRRLNGTRAAIAAAAQRRGLDPTFLGVSADGRKIPGAGNSGQRGGPYLGSGTAGDSLLDSGSDRGAG